MVNTKQLKDLRLLKVFENESETQKYCIVIFAFALTASQVT